MTARHAKMPEMACRARRVFFLIAALAHLSCGFEPGSKAALRVGYPEATTVQVRLPAGYDSTRAYPILIGLHGRGGRADWFLRFWGEISGHGVIYIVPEAPYPFENGFAWFRNQTADSLRIARERARSEEFIAEVARAASARFGGGKACLFGFSQGGNLAFHSSLRYADLFQGAIAFGTYLDMSTLSPGKAAGAKGLKVFLTHGKKDRVIPYDQGEAAYQELKKLGSRASFREIPGGHVVDEESLRIALDWMFPE